MHVAYMGVPSDQYVPADREPVVPTIGFLSRMCPDRGLERLVDAFILLKKEEKLRSAKLRLCGGKLACDESFLDRLSEKLRAAEVLADVDFLPAFDQRSKLEFLRGLSVLSVPEDKPVAYGLYLLEALSLGVPVVEPAHGCFPETLTLTGGGVLYEPNTAEKLAAALAPLLLDAQAARRLGNEGRAGVIRSFEIGRTAAQMIDIYERIIQGR
jgi:glycosyltransferase involved in cell wall biosynthesis